MRLNFTNGYRPRFDQISRILLFVFSREQNKKVTKQEIVSALGISGKQVEYLTSMMIGFGLIYPRDNTLTPLGKAIIQSDPYFDRPETLWIIHFIVSSNPKWIVWYRIINEVISSQDRYAVKEVCDQYFSDLAIHFSEKTISSELPNEVGAVFTAYSRTELSRLGILKLGNRGNYIKSDPIDMPDLAFLFCLLFYRDNYLPGSSAINIKDICLKESSPGKVLQLTEYQIRNTLNNLHDKGLIRIEQFADLDQVRLSDSFTQESILERIYEVRNAN
jgi:predicted transcriptional regulator